MIVVDSSAIIAVMDARDAHHVRVRTWLESATDDLVTTPMVVAEADHLVTRRGGTRAAAALRADLAAGAYVVDWWPEAIAVAADVAGRYADIGVGLTDASLVALAERVDTTDIATLDDRHFRVLRPLQRGGATAFRLLPYDD